MKISSCRGHTLSGIGLINPGLEEKETPELREKKV